MRSPLATSIATLIASVWWLYLARRDRAVTADLESLWLGLERNASRLIGVVALISAMVAATFATRSAAGADASGYLSQAASWFGVMPPVHMETLAEGAPELDGWLTTPLGWRPGTDSPICDLSCEGLQVPTYPAGLPLLMAGPHSLAGIDGASAVVSASAAAAVWATGMIAGGAGGFASAVLLATAPAFLYQSIQPMSDVPVTAAWMLCFLLRVRGNSPLWSVLAGVVCGVAVLIRPNLAPLAIVPLLMAPHKKWFAAPVAIAGAFLAFTSWIWYGSPLRSGYGEASELFSFVNVVPNLQRYFSWLITTSPLLLLAPLGIVRLKDDRRVRGMAAFASLVVIAYLVYAVFDQWSYLRFLLPAMAVFALLAAVELIALIARSPIAWRAPVFLALMLAVTAHGVWVARARDTFRLAEQFRRVEQVGAFVVRNAPDNAVVLSGEQSGSMRYYTGRPILRWEAATPETLTSAMARLEQSGRPVYVVLDAWENEPFLAKFKAVPGVALDWPAAVEAGTTHRTRLWRISDRDRFLAGENLQTVRLP